MAVTPRITQETLAHTLKEIVEQTLQLDGVDSVVFLHTSLSEAENLRSRALLERLMELVQRYGKPVAYLFEDGETVYTWDGRAVAYLSGDRLYGWNGRQLGWYSDGTIFDIYGYRAGFIKRKSPVPTQLEPVKPSRQMPRIMQMPQAAVVKPAMIYGYSRLKLEELPGKGGRLRVKNVEQALPAKSEC